MKLWIYDSEKDDDAIARFADGLKKLAAEKPNALRIDLTDTKALEVLEAALAIGAKKQAEANALVSLRPEFPWWQGGGLWPSSEGAGWIVMLRKVMISGRPTTTQ